MSIGGGKFPFNYGDNPHFQAKHRNRYLSPEIEDLHCSIIDFGFCVRSVGLEVLNSGPHQFCFLSNMKQEKSIRTFPLLLVGKSPSISTEATSMN